MKKTLISIFVFLALVCFGMAQPNNAVVINPAGGCGLLDGDGGFAFTTDTQVVATQSQNQNTTLKCQVKGVPNSSGQAVQYDTNNNPFFPGLLCGIISPLPPFLVLTDNWDETVSASGRATLICRFNANQ